ncbi:hypothetical protein SUGI_0881970 [Cryptomeria japonica]|uniref:uncharacterized protein LOC131074228 n=1 Tax=Cryptomeria japonica TaxID=3369 RepID=UPI002414B82A|nr:uncharacterized protein LOC131074228 [Cryptomeria japonica]GLJ42540.1 hypothetical protein SUGI_0881970 [Cryptomeria japonica]
MENNKAKAGSRSIFDLPPDYFDFASVSNSHSTSSKVLDLSSLSSARRHEEEEKEDETTMRNGWSCNTCAAHFSSLQQQRSHFKSDFHRFNVKWRMKGRDPIKEVEFEEVAQEMLLKEGDVSSISGSDEDSDELINTESGNGIATMKNQISISLQSGEIVLLWRSLCIGDREDVVEDRSSMVKDDDAKSLHVTDEELVKRLQSLVQESRDRKNLRVVLLASGGHFAGCVFDGNNIVAHKTYHRYVVRAKAGGRQSTKDSTGRAPKSGGASLRRYNEMALKKEILELLAAWKCYLDLALCIYIYAPSSNGQIFFTGENPPLSYRDIRVRRIPFTTRRPTLKEANRIYSQLTCVHFTERAEMQVPNQLEEPATSSDREKGNNKVVTEIKMKNKNKIEKEIIPEVSSELEHLDGLCISDVSNISNTTMVNQSTPLHEAAKSGNTSHVLELLEQGSDPCAKDERGRTPYLLAEDKDTRNVFRRFMAAYPDKWDWHVANVPSPLTAEIEAAQAAKQAEKDAKKKAKAKEMKKLRKEKEKAQEKSLNEQAASAIVHYGQDGVSYLIQKGKALPNMNSQAFQEELLKAQALEREKRAAAAMKRFSVLGNNSGNTASALPNSVETRDVSCDLRCSCCTISLAGKVPFHRYNYKYCSTSCMHVHRETLEDG